MKRFQPLCERTPSFGRVGSYLLHSRSIGVSKDIWLDPGRTGLQWESISNRSHGWVQYDRKWYSMTKPWQCDIVTLWHCDTVTLWHCDTVTSNSDFVTPPLRNEEVLRIHISTQPSLVYTQSFRVHIIMPCTQFPIMTQHDFIFGMST